MMGKISKAFDCEYNKKKFRNVSPNWTVTKISDNYIECKNSYGGKINLSVQPRLGVT